MSTTTSTMSHISGYTHTGRPIEAHNGAAPDFARYIAAFLAWIAAMPRRQRDNDELARFSDRELADIGLTRGDLGRIHSPEFAADYNQGRRSALFFVR